MIPHEFISESIDTLCLLIPRSDRSIRRWYKSLQKKYILDSRVLSLEHLKLEHRTVDRFTFWGDRLRILKETFDNHEPNGPLQWWRDDRKPVQWWTFWIAALVLLLTIIFGFTQCLAAILQLRNS